VLAEDDALAPGEVVLGQAGDLLEERRAALVVEPLGGKLLGCRGQADTDVLAQRLQPVLRREVDVDLERCCGRAVAHGRLRRP
jgi:hypothetical protein